ncbi:hypothetical protein O3M35_009763 [Rhynocoris fuscipes]|uniref:Integrase catalytic domain-containing protein n=1 Tax=Rhynocoris fuscipes TaxID=488301 RepID=A0AAW1DB48_9HEMI
MRADIQGYIERCDKCNTFQREKISEPLMPTELPEYPFQKIALDICEYEKHLYLVLEDYFSRWLDIVPLSSKSCKSIIRALKPIFATHGVPQYIRTDNSPFNSEEFIQFGRDWGFKLITSSPDYPQSNGMAEKGVYIAKQMITQILKRNIDWQKALLHYRSSPLTSLNNVTPSQLLMSRSLRSELPRTIESLKPKVVDLDSFRKADDSLKQKTKSHYDKHVQKECEFNIGERVWYRQHNRWNPGLIIKKLEEPRSYLIRSRVNSKVFRRTTKHIRKDKSTTEEIVN